MLLNDTKGVFLVFFSLSFSPFVFIPKLFCANTLAVAYIPEHAAVRAAVQNDNDNNTTNQIALPAVCT